MELIDNKFTLLDKIFREQNSLGDDKVIEILTEHRNLESRYVTDKLNPIPLENGIFEEEFHKKNIETIDYITENIDIGQQRLDVLVYLYSFLIYRYCSAGGEFLPTVNKFKHYLTILQLVFNTQNFNISYISSTLMRFFYSRSNSIYLQELIELIISASDNNWMLAFQYCRVLLYDKEFCFCFYPYEGTMHSGSHILFETILNKILWGRSDIKQEWINKRVIFFEKNKEIQFGTMPEYYLLHAKLYKCNYLSFDKKNDSTILNDYLNTISLPNFEIEEKHSNLYLLYVLKLTCLENLNKNEKIIEICDYLIQTLNKSDKEYYTYYVRNINWYKYNALKKLADKEKHIKWYFDIINIDTIEKIKNNVYLSPFMIQDNSNKNLYHFTNLEALKSIIEKNTLWLTRYDFLNDTKEIRYITEIF